MGQLMDKLNNLVIPILYPVLLVWFLIEIVRSVKMKKIKDNVYIALFACIILYVARNPNEAAELGGILFKAVKAASSFVCGLFVKILEGLKDVTV